MTLAEVVWKHLAPPLVTCRAVSHQIGMVERPGRARKGDGGILKLNESIPLKFRATCHYAVAALLRACNSLAFDGPLVFCSVVARSKGVPND